MRRQTQQALDENVRSVQLRDAETFRHTGTIRLVDSGWPNRQSRTVTTFPDCAASVQAASLQQNPVSLHILVVDDNAINQRVAAHILAKLGHTWVLAANGREALRAVTAERFDLVLMDIQMPDMDGLEATAKIREQEARAGGHLPIIATTANVIGADRERFLHAGMDGYVPKPIRLTELVKAIDEVLPLTCSSR